jgi:hypothetical protein
MKLKNMKSQLNFKDIKELLKKVEGTLHLVGAE